MTTSVPTRRWRHFAWLAAALIAVLAIASLASALPANAAPADGLTWKMSQHAWTSSSLSPAHAAGAPATKDPANGWVFPDTSVYYRPATGEMELGFGGSLTLGNIVQGGYRIELANPTISVDSAGNGVLKADVSYCASTADCLNPWIGPAIGTTITTFFLPDALVNDNGTHVEFTVTPLWATVGTQFDQDFLNNLVPALHGHFMATGSASDVNKPPSPLTVSFDYSPVGGAVTLAVSAPDAGSTVPVIAIVAVIAGAIAIAGIGGVAVRRRSR